MSQGMRSPRAGSFRRWRDAALLLGAAVGSAWPEVARAASESRPVVRTIATRSVPRGVRTEVFVPPDWRPGQPAGLLLFLTERRGSEATFRRRGLAARVKEGIAAGRLPATLAVSPRHVRTFLVDSPRAAMETFVAVDLVETVETLYPGVGGERRARAVWGISLGGWAALRIALRRPDRFGAVAVLAPWVEHLSWDWYGRRRSLLGMLLAEPVFGAHQAESRFEPNDLFRLAAAADPARVPAILVVTGERDPWRRNTEELVALLRGRGVPVEFRLLADAGHAWSSWLPAAEPILAWLADQEGPR